MLMMFIRYWWVYAWCWQLPSKWHVHWHCGQFWVQLWSRIHRQWSVLLWWVLTMCNTWQIRCLCLDIDECETNLDNCDDQSTFCFNTYGKFDCLCLSGYINPNGSSCQRKLSWVIWKLSLDFCSIAIELDECSDPSLNDCHMNATCTDIPGSYVCNCALGYEGNGTFCESMVKYPYLLCLAS